MTKALDYLIIIVVSLFVLVLIVIGIRSCAKLNPDKVDKELTNKIKMGPESTDSLTQIPFDTTSFEAAGVDPGMVDSLERQVAAELASNGKDQKEKEEITGSSSSTKKPSSEKKTSSASNSNLDYFVISGSFLMETNARDQVSTLKGFGYPAEILEFKNSSYYTVCVKRFSDRSEAETFKNSILKDHSIESYVLKQRFN